MGWARNGVFKIYEPHETAAPGAGDSAAIGCDGIGWHHLTSSNFWSLLGKSSYPDPSIRRHRPRLEPGWRFCGRWVPVPSLAAWVQWGRQGPAPADPLQALRWGLSTTPYNEMDLNLDSIEFHHTSVSLEVVVDGRELSGRRVLNGNNSLSIVLSFPLITSQDA